MGQAFTQQASSVEATSHRALDQALAVLRQRAEPYARSPLAERLSLAHQLLAGYVEVAEGSVAAGCQAKGLDLNASSGAEEWVSGPGIVIRNLRLLIETLSRINAGGTAIDAARVRTRPDGRVVVDVFPASSFDSLMYSGLRGEAWLEAGVRAEDVPAHAAAHYRTPIEQRAGSIVLVLGAGNVASIPPTDVLYKLFVEGKVCLLKMNPVNSYLGPFIERAFRPAIDRGLLAVAYGGADVGGYLADHPLVDEIHITGSDKTHDLLVWGPAGPEREMRKAQKRPLITKAISSELGNISPVIVVPGPYGEAELTAQGHAIGAAVTTNASFNCNAAKLLVQSSQWAGRSRLMRAVAANLAATPPRKAYYPGAQERFRDLVDSHPRAQRIGQAHGDALPWAILSDLDPTDAQERCFSVEPFCGILSETALAPAAPVEFLDAAVRFVNQQVWGTLAATIVIHPLTLKLPGVAEAFERAIADLRYGTVGINQWPALAYLLGTLPWGGHPSTTLDNIQSGRGWVHNTFMLERIEKSVLRGPLIMKPKPVWVPGHRTAHQLGRKMVQMEASPSWAKVPGLIVTALRG